MIVSLDFETRSLLDIRKVGLYAMAQHPTTDPWCLAYAVDDEEPGLWVRGDPFPELLADNLRDVEFHAWNASFERVFWWLVMTPRYGWPRPDREQFVDTAATAAAHALPRKLANAARVLGLDEQIHEDKHGLILRMARPRKIHPDGRIEWWDGPDCAGRMDDLYEACKQDVRTERAIGNVLRPLSSIERDVYLLDQRMNDRGVKIDRHLIEAARALSEEAVRRANQELIGLTDGALSAVTNTRDLREYLGVESVAKDKLRDLLADEEAGLSPEARRVGEIRQDAGKSSTAKLQKMLEWACSDDRVRGMLLYHAATTGRWAGKGPQPQNYPRPTVKDVERFIPLVLAQDYEALEAEHPVLVVLASLLRSMFVARAGHRLLSGDFAQVEARVLAWLAGQDELVELFASDGKVYEEMAAFIMTRKLGRLVTADEIAKDSEERQLGKFTVLGAGFQMGWETFQRQTWEKEGVWISDEDAQLAIEAYRERNDKVVQLWWDANNAAMAAVRNPGATFTCGVDGLVRFTVRGEFLWCQLPSGRFLAYPKPDIRERDTKWGTRKESVTYLTTEGYQWRRTHGYGGKWVENIVQATARDLVAVAMLRAERAGYHPVLTVHDEIVTEEPDGQGSLDEFLKIMTTRPRWATGLPVKAEGWEGDRYRK